LTSDKKAERLYDSSMAGGEKTLKEDLAEFGFEFTEGGRERARTRLREAEERVSPEEREAARTRLGLRARPA
jgi:hypothetical protein